MGGAAGHPGLPSASLSGERGVGCDGSPLTPVAGAAGSHTGREDQICLCCPELPLLSLSLPVCIGTPQSLGGRCSLWEAGPCARR